MSLHHSQIGNIGLRHTVLFQHSTSKRCFCRVSTGATTEADLDTSRQPVISLPPADQPSPSHLHSEGHVTSEKLPNGTHPSDEPENSEVWESDCEPRETELGRKAESSPPASEADTKSSGASLSAASEPFVPSVSSSQQITPRYNAPALSHSFGKAPKPKRC